MKGAAAIAAGCAVLVAGVGAADAQSIIRSPGQHNNGVEFEIHGYLAYDWRHGCRFDCYTLGPGFRVGIPIVRNGFVRSINNDVRINFGADVFWAPWYYRGYYGTWWLVSPVVMQWNFYLTTRWSVFGEAGVALDFYPYDGPNCYDDRGARRCDRFGFWPGAAVGARMHFRPGAYPTLTMRLGFPTGFNIGVSF